MKKYIISGGAGFIGTNLIKRLEGETCSIDNYSTGKKENHIKGEYIEADIKDIDSLDIPKPDVIFHLAALARIQPSFGEPVKTVDVNTFGTLKVLEWARKNDVKVVYAGSSSKWHDPYQSPYATSKYLGEELCNMYKRTYGLDVQIARFYNVYGEHEITEGERGAVIGLWRGMIANGEPIKIVGDGEQRRDFTYVGDIVDGLIKISESDIEQEAWELGSGLNYSINELADMFTERFNCEKEYTPDQKGNYRVTLRHDNQAVNLLGWKPKDRLSEYIKNL